MTKAEQVFIKKAAGPVIISSVSKDQRPTAGYFLAPLNRYKSDPIKQKRLSEQFGQLLSGKALEKAKKHGYIHLGESAIYLPFIKNLDVKKHELTHYLRDKKGKWSSVNYDRNPLAKFIEEFAAYKRGGGGFLGSSQAALWSTIHKSERPFLRNLTYNLLNFGLKHKRS